jgi:hypothetical protein
MERDDNKEVLHVRIDAYLKAELKRIAKLNRRSMAKQVEAMIEKEGGQGK